MCAALHVLFGRTHTFWTYCGDEVLLFRRRHAGVSLSHSLLSSSDYGVDTELSQWAFREQRDLWVVRIVGDQGGSGGGKSTARYPWQSTPKGACKREPTRVTVLTKLQVELFDIGAAAPPAAETLAQPQCQEETQRCSE